MATQEKEISYYDLRLRELLNTSFPNLATNEAFIKERSNLAAEAYEKAFDAGHTILECRRIANEVLFEGLYFSPFDMVYSVVSNEFDREIPDNELRSFALKMFPYCVEVFEDYNIHKDFEDSPEYDQLYTELTGQIQIWIEENGVQ
ncbi:DUF1896 domain-containing protein [Ornithobacterium rhinotracheale]|uniref:DUF1896 domain-containing protein n=1 Tax=Ornithobacterium rhinotracheale TaxID=28251 RepID=A0A3R5UUR4_ORNRH|nr:DUF1896 domain-containing protein [Ornithobacterium rhinotracheale]QAR30221.1 DUF1896 domain-containing protein [Ornithobacterium rhinotracheale]